MFISSYMKYVQYKLNHVILLILAKDIKIYRLFYKAYGSVSIVPKYYHGSIFLMFLIKKFLWWFNEAPHKTL